jgi:hypothetical protein
MRAHVKALILLAVVSPVGLVHAADAEDALLLQSQAPAPPPAQPFRLPLWQPSSPQPLPRLPMPGREQAVPAVPQRQTAVAPCVVYPMLMVPADPNIDPKMIVRRPPRAPAVEYRMREIPSNRCR